MSNPYFSDLPARPHLIRPGGLKGEIFDLRRELVIAFDGVAAGSGTNLLANFIFNGAGAVLIPGNYGYLKFASSTTIPQLDFYADPAGNLTVVIAQTTSAAFPAGFVNIATISLVAAQKTTLIPGVPIPIAADDILRFTVTGIPTLITVATLNLVLLQAGP